MQVFFDPRRIFLVKWLGAKIQSEVDGTGRMRDGADGDEVDSGFCDLADGLEVYSSAGFELDICWAEANGFAHVLKAHVVEENDIDSLHAKKTFHLLERIGLEFDADAGIGCAGGQDHFLEGVRGKSGSEVIILHHEHIMEADSVVTRATGSDGFFFQEAQAWRGFAGVEYDGICSANGFDKSTGHSGDAAESLDEIQGGALAGEDGGCRPLDCDNDIAFFECGAVGHIDLNLQ
jgi:hypothetical protein